MSWRTFRHATVSKRAENESNHSRRSRNSLQAAHGASGPDIWSDELPVCKVAIVSCPCRLRECSPQAQATSRCSSPLLPSVPSWKCCANVYPIPQQWNKNGRLVNCSCDHTMIPRRARVSRGSHNTTALVERNIVDSDISRHDVDHHHHLLSMVLRHQWSPRRTWTCGILSPRTMRQRNSTSARRGSLCPNEHTTRRTECRSASGSPRSLLRLDTRETPNTIERTKGKDVTLCSENMSVMGSETSGESWVAGTWISSHF